MIADLCTGRAVKVKFMFVRRNLKKRLLRKRNSLFLDAQMHLKKDFFDQFLIMLAEDQETLNFSIGLDP